MLKTFISKNKEIIILLSIIIIASYVRLAGLADGMPFTFDQAEFSFYVRDILNGKPVLIGPRTGIEGFYLGPLYFYMLVPFYWLFKGNPVGGAVMDAIFGILVIPAIYILVKDLFNKKIAVIAAILACFSPLLIGYSRYSWNPHPLIFFSVIYYLFLYKVLKGNEKYIILSFLTFAVGLQMEIASAFFYLPTTILIFLWVKYKPKNLLNWFIGFTLLLISFIPQVLFNLRHEFLTVKALKTYFLSNERFTRDISYLVNVRINQFFDVFKRVSFVNNEVLFPLFILVIGFYFLYRSRKEFSLSFKLLIPWLLINPILLIFSGERVWEHHYISIYASFLIILALMISKVLAWEKDKFVGFLLTFLLVGINIIGVWPKKSTSSSNLLFKQQVEAIDYIYKESKGQPFNVAIYVPSVYVTPYQYIFEWFGKQKYNYLPTTDKNVKLVYFIVEADYEIPARRSNWLYTRRNDGKMINDKAFGSSLIVEKRLRK